MLLLKCNKYVTLKYERMCIQCVYCVEEYQPKNIRVKWCLLNKICFSYKRVKPNACAKIYTNKTKSKLIVVPKTAKAKQFWSDYQIIDILDGNIIESKIKIYDDFYCCCFCI